jgi:hypothetical protein
MSVDFKGNKEAYWKIGLAQMMPPYVRAVRITKTKKDGTKEVVESAVRAKIDGGFYDKNGDYIPVFTGDEVEVTQVDDQIFQKWEKNRGTILDEQKSFFEGARRENPNSKVKIEDLPPELQVKEKERIDGRLRAKTLTGILGDIRTFSNRGVQATERPPLSYFLVLYRSASLSPDGILMLKTQTQRRRESVSLSSPHRSVCKKHCFVRGEMFLVTHESSWNECVKMPDCR